MEFTVNAGIIVVQDAAVPPALSAVGPRYLEVTPLPGETPIALLLTSPDETCISLYVQAPMTINGKSIGRLGPEPVLVTPAEWGTIYVSDEEIPPDTSFAIQVELMGGTLSDPAIATTWLWCDANNDGGVVDFDDVLCALDGFAGTFAGACSFFGADLEGGQTNVVIDFDDILGVLDAFAGSGYFDNPAHVDPCP